MRLKLEKNLNKVPSGESSTIIGFEAQKAIFAGKPFDGKCYDFLWVWRTLLGSHPALVGGLTRNAFCGRVSWLELVEGPQSTILESSKRLEDEPKIDRYFLWEEIEKDTFGFGRGVCSNFWMSFKSTVLPKSEKRPAADWK